MKIPIIASAALFILILIQTVLVPYLNKHLNTEEKKQYDRSQIPYLVIIELILGIAFIFTYVILRNINFLYILGFLILIVVIYDSFSDVIRTRMLNLNKRADNLILVKNISNVIFSIIFVGTLIYQQASV